MGLYEWHLDDEFGTDAQFTLCIDGAFVLCDDFLHVGESQTESFDIVEVACVDTIEFVEDTFDVVFLDADSVVLYGDDKSVVLIAC